MSGLDYITIPLTPIPEEQVVFVEKEQEGVCCRNMGKSIVLFNVICCGSIIGTLIYGFVWIVKTYP